MQSSKITSTIDFSLFKPSFENSCGDKREDYALRRGAELNAKPNPAIKDHFHQTLRRGNSGQLKW
jgi:hypothetical protein